MPSFSHRESWAQPLLIGSRGMMRVDGAFAGQKPIPMSMPGAETSLRRLDYLLLGIFCFCLFGYVLVPGRVLSGHEAVLPQNTREMRADHDWLIPKMGGEPWLERPPLPDWILAATDTVFG